MKVVVTALATLAVLGLLRTGFEYTRFGDQVTQESCGENDWQDYCVQRHVLPGIPLLRDERRTVQVHVRTNPARYLAVDDPFLSDVTITWTDSAATLTDSTGFALVLDHQFLTGLQS